MKVHNDLKELLESYNKHMGIHHQIDDEDVRKIAIGEFLLSNSLALGKPEPLAKNKQTQEYCGCLMPAVQVNGSWYECRDCKKQLR